MDERTATWRGISRLFGWSHWPMYALVILSYGQGNAPTIRLADIPKVGLFAAGCVAALIVVAMCVSRVGSLGEFLEIVVTPDLQEKPLARAGFLLFLCGAWGMSVVAIANLVTTKATGRIERLEGRIASVGHRNKCKEFVTVRTADGDTGFCLPGAARGFVQTPVGVPDNLQSGDKVVLWGKRNAYVFVVRQVERVAPAPD
jgi:hypothetical protein